MRHLILIPILLCSCADDTLTPPDADPSMCRSDPGACVDGGSKVDAAVDTADAAPSPDTAPQWVWDGVWELAPATCDAFDRMRLTVDDVVTGTASFWHSSNPTTGDGTSANLIIGWPAVHIDDMPPLLAWDLWRNADGTLSGTDSCGLDVVATRP